ncbi:MATE family efflux transporter [Clostridium transplantifaecale]|uniref:MATE family efflux transporter n=1 Tax=Clostridium transplantifaecale TaxID=2479838 RepID=UPI000F63A7D4|nr:MATE family efflux transporter [Clostridium transplantifaecale]
MKELIRPKDLTAGRPLPVLLSYSLPMFAGMFFQQAYNLADSWIAGNHIGSLSLGAVGTCYPVTVLYIAVASGLGIGTSIYCSQQFGSGGHQNVKDAVSTALLCFIPCSVFLMLLGLFACPHILTWLSVPEEALLPTRQYLFIYTAGLPFLFLYNISTGVLNGLGNSGTPLIFLIFSSFMNIILDLVLVLFIPLGISGLALATLLSQAASSLATLFAVKKLCRRLGGEEHSSFSLPILREILRLAVPSIVQHVFMSTGQLALQNIINGYGVITMTGYSIAFRINGLYVNSLMALSNALSGFIAQNKGAGKQGRIRQGYRLCLILGGCFTSAVVFLMLADGPAVLSFFVSPDPDKTEIIDAGMGFVRIVVPFYFLVCLKIVTDGALRGIGRMNAFMMSSISDVMVRLLLGDLFSRHWGINGVWWIWPAAWAVGTAVCCVSYRRADGNKAAYKMSAKKPAEKP